ncbi:MAG: IS21 family transposase [bacterium]
MKGWDVITQIKAELEKGKKVSEVARMFKVDRKTVRKYRGMSMDDIAHYKQTRRARKKKVDSHRRFIDHQIELMEEDGVINAQAIFNKVIRLGYSGSDRTLRRYVNHRIHKRKHAVRIYEPFETPPGFQAMVDMGESRKVWIAMRRTVEYFLVMTLGYSRKMYVEWYDRPIDTEMFIRFHQNAFAYLGGIPHEIVYDQTKLAVIKEQFGDIDFNQDFYGFSKWAGFRCFICRKSDPETKGKVESSIRYIKRSFLPGRRFHDHDELNHQWYDWLHTVADHKPNETTGDAPEKRWKEEKDKLKPLRDSVYIPQIACKQQPVYKDGFVKVLGNRYSVPWRYHRKSVKVRVCDTTIEIYSLDDEIVCIHERWFGKNKRIRIRSHYQKPIEESSDELARKLVEIYGYPELFDELRQTFPRHYRDQCRQFINLSEIYDRETLRKACYSILTLGGVSYRKFKKIVSHFHSRNFDASLNAPDDLPLAPTIPALELDQRSVDYYDITFRGRS